MSFTTYENRANPHVTIHHDGCKQIMKNGGKHKYGQECTPDLLVVSVIENHVRGAEGQIAAYQRRISPHS